MKITRRHVNSSYNEIDRRIERMLRDGDLALSEVHDERNAMLQGLYSVFMMLSDNWPEVAE